ncbi:MAG: bifunctional 3,4-dihydroxy-2-butanone-4-phosphate synthase/GTP cyclohydrolase II [Acidimicrobiia bacterium]|nr:bifunctional 3,4-dihydroxy-2-butanone-4-phosphate synthase/GTP cyclohydrolase II [Acidimicrobiia bacterium]
MNLGRIEDAVKAMARGEFVLVVDSEDRENEGDLIIAAEKVTADRIAFMVRYTSGLICLPTTGELLDKLELPLMVLDNTDTHRTAFTISIDSTKGTTTGISAADRAHTIRAVVDDEARASDFSRPGHIFPLRYQEGGVLVRPGHTEAAVDLARLAGLKPAGVLCEIVNDDGTMARGESLATFAAEHDIVMISIDDLVAYRWQTEGIVSRGPHATLPTRHGVFEVIGYESTIGTTQYVALVMGDLTGKRNVLTRVHSVCLTGDAFGSLRCDCGAQLEESMRRIAEVGEGVVVYNTSHEGRGIGIINKIAAYHLQDQGLDTVDANREIGHADDNRHYGVDAQILHDLGVRSVRLLTNNPDKIDQLTRFGVEVSGREALWVGETVQNRDYLATKAKRMGHIPATDATERSE